MSKHANRQPTSNHSSTASSGNDLREVVASALEAARIEVVARMTKRGFPLSLQAQELQIIASGNGGRGWTSQWATISVSGLRNLNVQSAIEDDTVPYRSLGLRPQLETLAQLLDRTTDLGTRPANFLPALSGVDAILARYLTAMVDRYLWELQSLDQPDQAILAQLSEELDELIEQTSIRYTTQLAIDGIEISSPLEYRDVKLRQLTPSERGHYWQSRSGDQLNQNGQHTDFVVPRDYVMVTPTVLLEVTTSRSRSETVSSSTLINRVALAFFLKGFDIASTGVVVGFDRPIWATLGQSHARSLVDEKLVTEVKQLTEEDFRTIVDLAYKMPDFGPGEASSREIALYRVLRGLGMHWMESGFLDHVIALEAALLKGVEIELSYRFALYGSLFLRNERNPEETFKKLRNIYSVRSKLVHGSTIEARKREQAIKDAPDIAKAVILRAVEHGWPNPQHLDQDALTP